MNPIALRHTKWNSGFADLILGPNESLAHGRRRREERRSYHLRVQPDHYLQHQRRANSGLNGRMRACEQDRKTAVWNFRVRRGGVHFFRKEPQPLGRYLAVAASAREID